MQILVNGLVTGLTIVLLSLAFAVVYLPTRIFHVALGGIYVTVPFVAWTCLQMGWGWLIAIMLSCLAGIVLSLLSEIFNHEPLERKHAANGAHMISSLGIYIMLAQIVVLIWGNEPKSLRTGLDVVSRAGSFLITRSQVIALVLSVATVVLFYCWLQFSKRGLQFRALSDNSKELALQGYSVRRLRLLAFGISGILCAISSLLIAYDVGFDPNSGLVSALLAVAALVIGGQHSFLGAVLGGILLGILRSAVVWVLSASWQEAVTFIVLAVFLLVRPQGLLGKRMRLEAEI